MFFFSGPDNDDAYMIIILALLVQEMTSDAIIMLASKVDTHTERVKYL